MFVASVVEETGVRSAVVFSSGFGAVAGVGKEGRENNLTSQGRLGGA